MAQASTILRNIRPSAGFVVPLALVGLWLTYPAMKPATREMFGLPSGSSDLAAFGAIKFEESELDKMPVVKGS